MRKAISIYVVALSGLILCVATFPAAAQNGPRTVKQFRGCFGPQIAVGSVNGVRLGVRYFPLPALALETAAGYLQVTLLRENERKEYTDGASVTLGGSWYSHPEASISPVISIIGVYAASTTLADGFSQTRFAIVPSLGSEYYFLRDFSVFFRFGPAFQFTSELNETRFETTPQFDAGMSLLF